MHSQQCACLNLAQRIGVARLCYVEVCNDVLDTDQDGASGPLVHNGGLCSSHSC